MDQDVDGPSRELYNPHCLTRNNPPTESGRKLNGVAPRRVQGLSTMPQRLASPPSSSPPLRQQNGRHLFHCLQQLLQLCLLAAPVRRGLGLSPDVEAAVHSADPRTELVEIDRRP